MWIQSKKKWHLSCDCRRHCSIISQDWLHGNSNPRHEWNIRNQLSALSSLSGQWNFWNKWNSDLGGLEWSIGLICPRIRIISTSVHRRSNYNSCAKRKLSRWRMMAFSCVMTGSLFWGEITGNIDVGIAAWVLHQHDLHNSVSRSCECLTQIRPHFLPQLRLAMSPEPSLKLLVLLEGFVCRSWKFHSLHTVC